MRLDFLNTRYDYIGSKGSEENGFPYVWGACCAFKPWMVHELHKKLSEQTFVDEILKKYGIDEEGHPNDVLFGTLVTKELDAKMLSGSVGENGELGHFNTDSSTINPTAFAVTCKGRYIKGL